MTIFSIVGEKLQSTLTTYKIKPRPHAGPGVGFSFLLPGIILVNRYKYTDISEVYNLSGELCMGLFTASIILLFVTYSSDQKKMTNLYSGMFLPFLLTSFRLYYMNERGLAFSAFGGVLSSYGFTLGFLMLMRSCPHCFSFAEASIMTQALLLFLFCSMENMYEAWNMTPELDFDIATLILQVGFLGVLAICTALYCVPVFRSTGPFYAVVFGVAFLIVIPTLHLLLRRSPVLWILLIIWTDNAVTVWLFLYWILCVGVAAVAVASQIQEGQHASTSVRKYFHILAVAVYLPGLVNACCLLYLASVVVLALFVVLELIRLLNIPPLGSRLQDGFAVYADEKDAGNLALTPIYLLSGCSLPLWLHPLGCVHPSALLSLCSGLLSVGVGDTLASSVGSNFGRHKWPGTQKTVEGTLACIFGQILTISIMSAVGVIQHPNWVMLSAGIILASFVEAKTDQVDNLVLPLITFLVI